MNTVATWQTGSTGSKDTERLAEQIGRNLKGGEVIELISDLGGGKTTFVRGLARGMGSEDHVSSPTFTISREYIVKPVKGRTFHRLMHFDFYRLHEPGIMQHELHEAIRDEAGVVVIEWADITQGVLPHERLTVDFKTTGETTRELHFKYSKTLEYLLRGLN